MPLCTNCAETVAYLYTLYHSVNNVRLEQCPSCRAPADPYVEHDPLVIALDLILLKRGVYRHLLFNRGTPPRKMHQNARGYDRLKEQSTEDRLAEDKNREMTRRWLIIRIGAGVVLVDSLVRWSRIRTILHSSNSPLLKLESGSWIDNGEASAFLRILLGSLVETATFHGGITLASILVLTALDWHPPAAQACSSLSTRPCISYRKRLPRYSHISLCLLYSSFTKFMLLAVLSVWGSQVQKDVPPPTYVYKIPLDSQLWHLLDDDVLDRTWLVRNLLGGMSAGFGLRVVLDCHPFFTTLVIFSGWAFKTSVVSLVRDFIGPGRGVEETWLAYSIP
ncbi:Arv1-domain-containing protein [Lactarius pseudohatsudake]|nr:Arv1-domain-containing protein [Lactarius pseudohatsudake]